MGYGFLGLAILVWGESLLQVASLVVRSSADGKNATSEHSTKKKDISQEALRSCLDDKRIVFIGPSTSRSDYFALTFFAEYGRWPDQNEIVYGPPGQIPGRGPNPLFGPTLEYGLTNVGRAPLVASPQCTIGSAESFLWYSNSVMNGHELCDCYKNDPKQVFHIADIYNQTENRIYVNQNVNTGHSTMISYFQWFGDVVHPRGSVDFSPLTYLPLHLDPPKAVDQQCPVGQFKGGWDWTMQVQDFISNFAMSLKPTHLIIDAAYWPTLPTNTALWEQISLAGAKAVAPSKGKVLWRTVPLRHDYPIAEPSSAVNLQPFTSKGWQLYDAANMVKTYRGNRADDEIFFDTVHLRPQSQSHLMWDFLQTHVCPAR